MSCSALTSNLHQCRNWTVIGQDFCHAHKSMTPSLIKERWIKKYILGENGNPLYTIVSLAKKDKILSDLNSGFIKLTKRDIQKIPARDPFVDIYLLLIEHNFAHFGDHPKMEVAGLWLHQILIHHFPFADGSDYRRNKLTTLKHKLEQYLITSSGHSFYKFLQFLGKAAIGRQNVQENMVLFVPTVLDSNGAKELSWYSYSELDSIRQEWIKRKEDHPLLPVLVERWLPDIKELYHTEKAIQRIKMDHCKEEIMMNRWHPARVEKYLNMGIDAFDM